MQSVDIVKLPRADLAQLQALLREYRLPDDDCDAQIEIFSAIYQNHELIAAGGLEPGGDYALLRSIVVRADQRGLGLARQMTDYLLRQAEAEGRAAVYLLTDSAEAYFARFGFHKVERAEVPSAITQTRQFAALCPASASCLYLSLPRA